MVAMVLDSSENILRVSVDYLFANIAGRPLAAEDRLWLALTDLPVLTDSTEELLEYLSALGLLMLVGNLYSVGALGCAPQGHDQYAGHHKG